MPSETAAGGFLTAAFGLTATIAGAAITMTGRRQPGLLGWVGMLLVGIGLTLTALGFGVAGGAV
ncbi:hypothetical protein SAMN06269185_3318 [Natronoarchaeum philippinense]|uniref:Uncharacterized protein n=1 Tax=Natronoarchaeum philippinense TaxID=558529 RepID=A0A285P951_NATPI|nr:hypothetical protein [Natronoarchaeum philippinense]SNZ18279.1 hypothetical protein SAMN06269185_3318 [Natronoarchaeum philippinense]